MNRAATVASMSKQDARYLALIDDYLRKIKESHVAMKQSKREIDRLKAVSRRKLAEIDAILHNGAEATL
jgi:hypothetical protein